MVYELYVDSLFLVNFVMNLYLLTLVNITLMRTATRMRIVLGAGVGAIVSVAVLVVNLPLILKCPVALFLGTVGMLRVTFLRCKGKLLWRAFVELLKDSFLLGGMLLFLQSIFPGLGNLMNRISVALVLGFFVSWLIYLCRGHMRRQDRNVMCSVTLISEGICVKAEALVDSGNSLREPISGAPVSVIDRKTYQALWGDEKRPYRVIPYRSVGKKRGLMEGYLLPALEVELNGMKLCCNEVYVAVCEEDMAYVLLHPKLLETTSQGTQKRRESKDDFKSGNAGETAV